MFDRLDYVAQNTIIILDSIVNIIGDLYDRFMSKRIFILMPNKILISALRPWFALANHLVFFIS